MCGEVPEQGKDGSKCGVISHESRVVGTCTSRVFASWLGKFSQVMKSG